MFEKSKIIDIVEPASRNSVPTTRASLSNVTPVKQASLDVDVKASVQVVRISEPIEYEILVENNHVRGFRDVQITLALEQGMKFTGVQATAGTLIKDN